MIVEDKDKTFSVFLSQQVLQYIKCRLKNQIL